MAQRTTLFISHGGGPLPLLGDENHREMVTLLKEIRSVIEKPSAILLISAHWEESAATVTTGSNPSLIYDYSGFPPESYKLQYSAPGEPNLAQMVQTALSEQGIPVEGDLQRGFDHGMFVPLSILYPEANIPVVQLSLVRNLDPKLHIEIGRAVAKVPYENLLVIGSGFSFHNMRVFFSEKSEMVRQSNIAFENWIESTLTDSELSESEREDLLVNWEKARAARFCHPREDHLIPLHFCYGVEQRAATDYYRIPILDVESSFLLWR